MSRIKVLDQDTINQIAAGEVVERPSSIVKELVENAIDASSTAITVEIKGGGIDFIRVTDNGCGIAREDVREAFLPHATSKISDAEDLLTVQSLGFRGEALASISAVAKVEMITKTDETVSGVRYVIEGGCENSFEDVGCPEGTTLIIRNLFYNTPARRKFLKTAMTEAGYVETFMQRLALSRPDISFIFINENRNRISTSGNGKLKDAVYQIFGREIALNLLPVSRQEKGIRLEGFVGKPVISRGNRNYEIYYVNGRYLRDPLISRGIEEGYKGHAMVHKFPFALLMITMDPLSVDVNVHPAKMEMRFHNREDLYNVLIEGVREAFVKKELIPKVTIGREKKETPVLPRTPEPFETKRRQAVRERGGEASPEIRLPSELIRKEPASVDTLSPGEPRKEQSSANGLSPGQTRKESPPVPSSVVRESARYETAPPVPAGRILSGTQLSLSDETVLGKEAREKRRILGQVFGTFWLFEYEDKLYFVDQHAAHEKVMYERFMKEIAERKVDRQILAPPLVLTLPLKDQEKLKSCREVFEKMGFVIEEFGDDDYCIRQVPTVLLGMGERSFFLELFDQIQEETGKLNLDVITKRVATMACKAAVKGNTRMSLIEMEALLDELMELENPYQCPHGRPTLISMSRYELEKKFKR